MHEAAIGSTPEASVSMHFVRCVLAKALQRGLDGDALLRDSGIAPRLVSEARARVPVPCYAALELAVMQALGDESMGYAPRVHKLGGWAMACRASVHPGSLGQALHRLLRCYELFDWGPLLQLSTEGRDAVLAAPPHAGPTPYEAFGYERYLLTVFRFACWLLDRNIQLKTVGFEHERPPYANEYRGLFLSGRLLFGQPRTTMRFDRGLLELPIVQDDHGLEALLLQGPMSLFTPRRGADSWTSMLRERLTQRLPQMPDFEDLASSFDLHPQTLRRRLALEGMTYNELKDEVRRSTAEYHLRQRSLSVEEIAYRCGFSEASALIRAFKRWNGVTPQAYAERRPPRDPVGKAAGKLGGRTRRRR